MRAKDGLGRRSHYIRIARHKGRFGVMVLNLILIGATFSGLIIAIIRQAIV